MQSTIFKVRPGAPDELACGLSSSLLPVVLADALSLPSPALLRLQIFTTKHSLTLPSQVFAFVERILIEVRRRLPAVAELGWRTSSFASRDLTLSSHGLLQHEVEQDYWAESCDHLAREYMRGEGTSLLALRPQTGAC